MNIMEKIVVLWLEKEIKIYESNINVLNIVFNVI